MKTSGFFVIALLFTCIIQGMSVAQDKTYTVEVIDGVRHINNHAALWGDEPRIELIFEGFLGKLESEDENYMFYNPADIAGDSEGNLYVLDAGNFRIQKFDPNGKYIHTIGRNGQGPGEFLRPLSIDIGGSDNIYVANFSNDRLEILTSEGKYTGTIKIYAPYVDYVRALQTGEIVMKNIATENINRFRPEPGKETWMPLIHIHDREGNILRRFGEATIYKPKLEWKTGLNRMFYDVDIKDNVYTVMLWQNRLEKFRPDGTQIFRTNRPVDPDEGIEEVTIKSEKMPAGFSVDPKGRMWFLTKKRLLSTEERADASSGKNDKLETDAYILYLYDENGVFLNAYQLKQFCDGIRVIGNKIYILEKRYSMRFYVYNIVEK
ncbi:NHL repeat-containing protein [candidate division KSB1 bacterium]